MIIDGKKIARKIYDEIKKTTGQLEKKPCLGAILVGEKSSSLRYIKQKRKWAEYTGINFKLESLDKNISEEELIKKIIYFNNNEEISGFIVQLPLPKHINENKIINLIKPEKDVDGFHPINQGKILIGDNTGLQPCTPVGVIEILKHEDIELSGKNVVVIGRSNIVGKPITAMLINAGATITSCNSKTVDLKYYTKNADIIISATGQPGLITTELLNDKTIVIDVGFTVIDGKIYGDCDFNKINTNLNKITPVPGGVGALTVAILMKNTLKAFINQQ